MACSLILATQAQAQEADPNFPDALTGDWNGRRTRLADRGMEIEVAYKFSAWRSARGAQTGSRGLANLDAQLSVDGKVFGSANSKAFFYVLADHGGRPNDLAGTGGGIDNIEVGTPGFRLYEAWLDHSFAEGRFSILAGLHDLNSEFYVTETSGLFLNPTFGIGTEMAVTGQNGPSIFPATSLAARLAFAPTETAYLLGGIYDGVPGDPARPRGTHISLGEGDGSLVALEGGLLGSPFDKLGAGIWMYTARQADLATGAPARSRGGYFLVDRGFAWMGTPRTVSWFARIGFTAGNVETFKYSWSTGTVLSHFSARRRDAQLGLGLSSARFSRKFAAASGLADRSEWQLELTYRDRILRYLWVQPDIQYTIHPGGDRSARDSVMVGVRMEVRL